MTQQPNTVKSRGNKLSGEVPSWLAFLAYLSFLLALVVIIFIVAALAPQMAPYLSPLLHARP